MQLKFLDSTDSVNSFRVNIQDQLTLAGLLLQLKGTNDTGQTVEADDVGRMKVAIRGTDVIDIDASFLYKINDLVLGTSRQDSNTAGAFTLHYLIPFRFADNNVFFVNADDQMEFSINFKAGYDTAVASHTASLFGVVETGVQMYTPYIRQLSENLAASQEKNIGVNFENIDSIWVTDLVSNVHTFASSNMSKFGVEIGGVSSEATVNELIDFTSLLASHESATQPVIAQLYAGRGEVSSRLHDQAIVRAIGGSGGTSIPQVAVFARRFTPIKAGRTQSLNSARLAEISKRKANAGFTDTLRIMQSMK